MADDDISFNHPEVCSECMAALETIYSEPIPYSMLRTCYKPNPDQSTKIKNTDKSFEIIQRYIEHIEKLNSFQNSLLSPIRKLSDDVLIEIFGHVAAGYPKDGATYNEKPMGIDMAGQHGIWAIREVCAYWKNLVDTSQELWTSFSYGGNIEGIHDCVLKTRTSLCLQFSKAAMLSVSIIPNHREHYEPKRLSNELFNYMLKHANRFYRLAIDVHILDHYNLNPVMFSNLKMLYIEDSCYRSELDQCWCDRCPYKFFATAESLEEIELQDVAIDDIDKLNLKEVKLLSLSGHCRSSDTSKDVEYMLLQLTPQLQCLNWVDIFNWERRQQCIYGELPASLPPPLINLPLIHTLNLERMGKMWSTVLVPNLFHFKSSSECFFYTQSFISLIKNSGCALKSMDIRLCSKTDYKEAFRHLPDVENLTLSLNYSDAGIRNLDYLIWNPKGLLPRLKILILKINVQSFDLDTFQKIVVDIIHSREVNEQHGLSGIADDSEESVADSESIEACLSAITGAGKEFGVQVRTDVWKSWRARIRSCRHPLNPDDEDDEYL